MGYKEQLQLQKETTNVLTEQHGMLIIILEKEIFTKFVSIFYLLFIRYMK